MRNMWWIVSMMILWVTCAEGRESADKVRLPREDSVGKIVVPQDYSRVEGKDSLFTVFLRSFRLKKSDTVYLYNGKLKGNQNAQYAVLDIDVGSQDLQQCADAVIRLRAEYLYREKKYSDINFRFTNGDWARFKDYAEGYRAIVINNQVRWVKKEEQSYSYATFKSYLNLVFMYAGSASLHGQMKHTDLDEVQPGDVLIQKGNPYGHAVMVMDVAKNKNGKKIMLLAQSYMPAQDIHILKNNNNPAISPWYECTPEYYLLTPEWEFTKDDLKTW